RTRKPPPSQPQLNCAVMLQAHLAPEHIEAPKVLGGIPAKNRLPGEPLSCHTAATQSNEDGVMNEHVELTGLMENPPARRLLLLLKALQYVPFDRAIELARTAEVFVTGSREPLDISLPSTIRAPHEADNTEDIRNGVNNSEPVRESVSAGRSS